MPRSATFQLADIACNGQLAADLIARRAKGESLRAIVAALAELHDVNVSHQTVANWFDMLDAEVKA